MVRLPLRTPAALAPWGRTDRAKAAGLRSMAQTMASCAKAAHRTALFVCARAMRKSYSLGCEAEIPLTPELHNMAQRHRVVILGGGFAGLNAARKLKRADADVTVIDRRNFHLFQPLLYQVATGSLSPGQIAAPLRSVLRRHKNTEVLLG